MRLQFLNALRASDDEILAVFDKIKSLGSASENKMLDAPANKRRGKKRGLRKTKRSA